MVRKEKLIINIVMKIFTYSFPAALINAAVDSLTWILLGAPLLSMRAVVLTV